MRGTLLFAGSLLSAMAGTALAQEPPHDHQTHRLGSVSFPNSGAPGAQAALAYAREAVGDHVGSTDASRRLLSNWRDGDTDRPEFRKAQERAGEQEVGRD